MTRASGEPEGARVGRVSSSTTKTSSSWQKPATHRPEPAPHEDHPKEHRSGHEPIARTLQTARTCNTRAPRTYAAGEGWLPLDWLWDRASPDPTPEQYGIGGEERQRLLEALGVLSNRERDVLGLKFAGGPTNRAIARLTGLGESHVGVIVYRAVGKLRARLGGEEVDRA